MTDWQEEAEEDLEEANADFPPRGVAVPNFESQRRGSAALRLSRAVCAIHFHECRGPIDGAASRRRNHDRHSGRFAISDAIQNHLVRGVILRNARRDLPGLGICGAGPV